MTYQLTSEHAKLWLPVVRELREYYEGKKKEVPSKYLCNIAQLIEDDLDKMCKICLWTLFEGEECPYSVLATWVFTPLISNEIYLRTSISRLKRWEKELEKIIKEEK